MLYEGFGNDVEISEDQFLADCEDWLDKKARFLTKNYPARYDDTLQEGRITLWRKYQEPDRALTDRVGYAMGSAKLRMKEVAYREARLTGMPSKQGRPEVEVSFSMDSLQDEGMESLFFAVDSLEGVEIAYHHGEILEALNSLTAGQRRYVYARFWCGIDETQGDHNESVKIAKELNTFMKRGRDVHWKAARTHLVEALSHLSRT